MSHALVAAAVVKLEGLSEERADYVIALSKDLTQLEAQEDTADLKAAQAVLATGDPAEWPTMEEVRTRLEH